MEDIEILKSTIENLSHENWELRSKVHDMGQQLETLKEMLEKSTQDLSTQREYAIQNRYKIDHYMAGINAKKLYDALWNAYKYPEKYSICTNYHNEFSNMYIDHIGADNIHMCVLEFHKYSDISYKLSEMNYQTQYYMFSANLDVEADIHEADYLCLDVFINSFKELLDEIPNEEFKAWLMLNNINGLLDIHDSKEETNKC